ncbi:MAG: hypothetical protein K2X34_01135 [Hyphomonadaceae bacterium]|nr:hypothetical protein [Hyphomonadaceae bacterium]
MTAAAAQARISRQALYTWRRTDPKFAHDWDEAIEAGTDLLERAALKRAVEGVKKPVFQGGEKVGEVTEYSDTLLIFLLKARRPAKYRERYEVKHDGAVRLTIAPEDVETCVSGFAGGGDGGLTLH